MKEKLDVSFEIVTFEEWRSGIAPLWGREHNPQTITAINNRYGDITYLPEEWFTRIVLFPILARHTTHGTVGWLSSYNISDKFVRFRGLYVPEQHRGRGVASGLIDFACRLWPRPWEKALIYARASKIELYRNHWNFRPCSGHDLRTAPQDRELNESGVLAMVKEIDRIDGDQGSCEGRRPQ